MKLRIMLSLGIVFFANLSWSNEWHGISYGGKIRIYDNHHFFQNENVTNASAFSAGGQLQMNKELSSQLSLHLGYYIANNLGANSDDPGKIISLLPGENINILGEANFRLSYGNHQFSAGRIALDTPFANAADAFMIPVTFLAGTGVLNFEGKSKISIGIIDQFKDKESDEFVDTGTYITQRFSSASTSFSTSADYFVGYQRFLESGSFEIWDYYFSDLFNLFYIEGFYKIPHSEDLTSSLHLQMGMESEVGDKLLKTNVGTVDSQLFGVKYAIATRILKVMLSYNSVPENKKAYNAGAWLSPFSFFTEAIYTNLMTSGIGNVHSGEAYKLMMDITGLPNFLFRIGYADFSFINDALSRKETNFWIRWSPEIKKGVSIWLRTAFANATNDLNDLHAYRIQFQYEF
ncbi:MAG: hypothetical protein KDD61_02355 [Bdellovibrionales bacterium]|nr:hypothetical protein [Bdellovibrionales bacterium]